MANNVFQVKRTNTSGRTPNTTGSYATNTQYIAAGEFALNMADGILYSSNGSAVITVGSNLVNQRITNSFTIDSNKALRFQTVNTSAVAYFIQQNDDNFVFYSTNTAYGARPVWAVYANSITSNLQILVPLQLNSGVVANNSLGTAGQVLTTNSTGVYWSSVGGTGTVTSVATGNGMTGGPITTTGTVSVLANNGITANSTGVFAVAGLGTVVNSTGINVNANNGLTATAAGVFVTGNSGLIVNSTGVHILANNGITANSTGTFVTQGTGVVVNATGVHVNAAYINTIAANSATFVLANNGIISNSTGVFVNGNNGLITNSTGVHVRANSGIVANSTGTFVNGNTGIVVNSTGVFVNATYIGTISANNASFLGGVAAASYVNTSGNYTLSGNLNFTAGANSIALTNGVSNWIYYGAVGTGAPAFTTRSAGTKLVLYPTLGVSQVDYGFGIDAGTLWSSIPGNDAGQFFKWYGGTTEVASLSGTGNLTLLGSVNAASHTVGSVFIANATQLTTTVPFSANGGTGTAGQVLTSNGSTGSPYWSTASGGSSNSVYMKGGAATIGTLASEGTNIFRVNANTLNYNTTISTGENAQATGPISVASGITLTVESGARVAIV